ncbi:holo-ACP synthase [Bacillus salacetis]|uniref:Holo-[acyl-carrier-protein] synthase n=1 Tax=Bacillus salacetis TaxID=2315464 RepID=A0A3A1R010_9BACI|nr:holo-ACP synthase [Bacillus salacetis]RIW32742.1 holo-ACP synthase [Bacillus salacetis]
MIRGIGLDIVEIERIDKLAERQPKFIKRVLTAAEADHYLSLSGTRRSEFLAGRFAAKEAFAKACGTGIGAELSFNDIEIRKDPSGKPYVAAPVEKGVHLSITHSRDFAAAQVIIEELD